MTDEERDAVWDRFDEAIDFSPSIDPEDWPGFAEPTPSVTYDIHYPWNTAQSERAAEDFVPDLHHKALSAFRVCVAPDEAMYVLDWKHPCYWFYPHRATPNEDWGVSVFPDGDYYIFVAKDFSFGTLGHPWEATICVFGQVLLDAFERFHPLLFDRVLRRNGDFIDPTHYMHWKKRRGRQRWERYIFYKTFFDKTRVAISIIRNGSVYEVITTVDSPSVKPMVVVTAETDSLASALKCAKHERGLWDRNKTDHGS